MDKQSHVDRITQTKFVGKWRTINKDGKEHIFTISNEGKLTQNDEPFDLENTTLNHDHEFVINFDPVTYEYYTYKPDDDEIHVKYTACDSRESAIFTRVKDSHI